MQVNFASDNSSCLLWEAVMRRFGLSAVFILAVLVISVRASRADSIVLTSPGPGVYGYGIEVDAGSPGVMAVTGDSLTLTGLFGVTGASAAPNLGFTATFTSTSATFTETGSGASTPANPGSTPVILPDFFFVDSADTTIGNVSYVATTSNQGVLSGTAQGPVTPPPAVPEPSSLILAGSGLLGLAGIARRKFVG
jgi:PEP-CTERM motif